MIILIIFNQNTNFFEIITNDIIVTFHNNCYFEQLSLFAIKVLGSQILFWCQKVTQEFFLKESTVSAQYKLDIGEQRVNRGMIGKITIRRMRVRVAHIQQRTRFGIKPRETESPHFAAMVASGAAVTTCVLGIWPIRHNRQQRRDLFVLFSCQWVLAAWRNTKEENLSGKTTPELTRKDAHTYPFLSFKHPGGSSVESVNSRPREDWTPK